MDILLQLPEMLRPSNHSISAQQGSDGILIPSIMMKIQLIWERMGDEYHMARYDQTDERRIFSGVDLWDYVAGPSTLPDSGTAITMAFYSLVWILILAEMGKGSVERQIYHRLMVAHCTTNLAAAQYIEAFEDGCGYIRMIFPLRCVVLVSPELLQKERARERLELWCVDKGLDGICRIALMA